jgi:hypothetical protein
LQSVSLWTENVAGRAVAAPHANPSGEAIMKNPLDSLWGTIISGLIVTLILHNIVSFGLGG